MPKKPSRTIRAMATTALWQNRQSAASTTNVAAAATNRTA
jgi:hypothetical protein